jgi:hypothetical protein
MDYEILIPGTAKAVIQNSKTNGSCVPRAAVNYYKTIGSSRPVAAPKF